MQHRFHPSREAAWKTVSSLIIHLSCCIRHITCLFYQYFWNKHHCHANTPGVHYPTEIFFIQCNTLETVKALRSWEIYSSGECTAVLCLTAIVSSGLEALEHLYVPPVVCNSDGVRRDTLFSFWPPLPSQIPHQSIWFMFVWLSLDHSCFSNSCCWLFWSPDGFIAVLKVSFMGRMWWGSPSLYVDPRRLVTSGEALVIYALQPS